MSEKRNEEPNNSPKHIRKTPPPAEDLFQEETLSSEESQPILDSRPAEESEDHSDFNSESGFYDYVVSMHRTNKRALRDGYIALLVLPFILIIFMNLIDGDRVIFLLVWIICMFALAAFLIFVAYSDHRMQRIMANITLNHESLGELMDIGDAEARIREIIRQRRSLIWSVRDRTQRNEDLTHVLRGKALHKEDKNK